MHVISNENLINVYIIVKKITTNKRISSLSSDYGGIGLQGDIGRKNNWMVQAICYGRRPR